MKHATTSCKGCVFAEYSPHPTAKLLSIQTGCKADRLELFKTRHEAWMTVAEPYFNLSKFCTMYRGTDWTDKNGFDTDKAREELMPLFGIGVYDHNVDAPIERLHKTVDSIKAIDYPSEKMKLVISTFTGRDKNELVNVINKMQEKIYLSSAIFHIIDLKQMIDKEVFKKLVEAAYFVNIRSGAVLPPDIFNIIDKSQNDDVLSTVMYEGEGYSIIHKSIVNNLYLKHLDYEAMVDNVRELSQEQKLYREL